MTAPPRRPRPLRLPGPSGGAGSGRWPALTVPGWFRLIFAVLALLAVAGVLVIFQLIAAGRRASADLDNGILPAQAQAYRLQGALVDQETGVRGFALARQPDFLQPYSAGLATAASAQARLHALIGGNPSLAADLADVQRAAASWRRNYALPLIAQARKGPLSDRQIDLLDASKSSFDHLRALFARQNRELAAAASRDGARVSEVRTIDDWVFAAVVAALVLVAVALTLVLHRAVVRPLNRLRNASQRVVSGDFGHRIDLAGPADLRAVAADVEAMRSALVTALDDARSSQDELMRSNAELEQFAYVASHDLQEPLRKVASFCQLLERRYADQLDDRARQYIGFAVDGAKRMQRLINDLLTFSRVGRGNVSHVQLPLDDPLDRAIAALDSAIEDSGTVIERPGPLPEVIGDATLLAMLWQNLIGNGIKFRSPDRAPVIRVTVTAVSTADSGDMWEFCVLDNGIGIPAEFSEKVFVIFQRLHGRDAYPGTGIGLALCKRIVEYHGGSISIDTAYTSGTRICFTLPRIGAGPPGEDDDASSNAASSNTASSTTGTTETSASTEGIPA
jgi:signal transduction histidine kinase